MGERLRPGRDEVGDCIRRGCDSDRVSSPGDKDFRLGGGEGDGCATWSVEGERLLTGGGDEDLVIFLGGGNGALPGFHLANTDCIGFVLEFSHEAVGGSW